MIGGPCLSAMHHWRAASPHMEGAGWFCPSNLPWLLKLGKQDRENDPRPQGCSALEDSRVGALQKSWFNQALRSGISRGQHCPASLHTACFLRRDF